MAFKMPASLSKPSGFGAFPGARPSGGGLPGMGGIPQRASARMPPPGAGQRAAPRTAPSAAAVVQQNTSETVTFDATHRHWTGKLLLHRDHKFDKEGRGGGGGTWTVTWSGNSDRGDLTAELSLGWTGWDAEILVSTDLGMTWVCDDYVFNLHLYGTPALPEWMGEHAPAHNPDEEEAPARSAPPSRSSGSSGAQDWGRARGTGQLPEREDAGEGEGDRATAKPAAEEKKVAAVPATGGRPAEEKKPMVSTRPVDTGRRPGGRRKMGFKMPSRQERAAAVCKKYRDIGEILSGAHHDPETDRVTFTGKMHKAEAPEIVSFLKIALADLYQLNHLTMKYSKTNAEGETVTEEAIPSELLGMKKADQELLEKYNLVKYLESDHEKRMKILAPAAQRAFKVVAPYLETALASSAGSAADVRAQNCRCEVCGVDLLKSQLDKHNGGKKHLKMVKLAAEGKK